VISAERSKLATYVAASQQLVHADTAAEQQRQQQHVTAITSATPCVLTARVTVTQICHILAASAPKHRRN